MDSKNKYSEKIADYLFDNMTEEERGLFEKDILLNEELADEYNFQSKAIRYIESKVVLEEMKSDPYLSEAQQLVEEYFESKKNSASSKNTMKRYLPSRNHRSLWLSAAAVILIGLISTVSLMVNDPYDSLFKSYYSPIEEASIIKRGENVDLDIEITNAIQLYFTGDYSKSSEKFQRLNTTSPNNPIINFYLGLNMMALAQYGEAIIQFENYLDSFELFLPEVKWYLSLCYLKTRDVEKAKILIEELENYPGKLGEDSHTLNRKVERRLIK